MFCSPSFSPTLFLSIPLFRCRCLSFCCFCLTAIQRASATDFNELKAPSHTFERLLTSRRRRYSCRCCCSVFLAVCLVRAAQPSIFHWKNIVVLSLRFLGRCVRIESDQFTGVMTGHSYLIFCRNNLLLPFSQPVEQIGEIYWFGTEIPEHPNS